MSGDKANQLAKQMTNQLIDKQMDPTRVSGDKNIRKLTFCFYYLIIIHKILQTFLSS